MNASSATVAINARGVIAGDIFARMRVTKVWLGVVSRRGVRSATGTEIAQRRSARTENVYSAKLRNVLFRNSQFRI